jgi:hypothetical protein
MRIRHIALSLASILGTALVASAQQPPATLPPAPAALAAQAPAGMTVVPNLPPVAPAPAPAMAPVVVSPQPGCGTPAPAYVAAPAASCATEVVAQAAPAAASSCNKCGKRSVFDRVRIGTGTANPVGCGCMASDRNFVFGGCRQFFTPGKTCGGADTEYGCGGEDCYGAKDRCKHITSFHNR